MSNTPSNEDVQKTAEIAKGMIEKLEGLDQKQVTVDTGKLKDTWASVANLSLIVLNLRTKIVSLKNKDETAKD